MATSVTCSAFVGVAGFKEIRNVQSKKAVSSSQRPQSLSIRALQLQSAPLSRDVENTSCKGDAEDAALKVFADETKGIVCYRTESGEVVCEGMDEGPHFYPPCGANFYMPDTRAAAILPLLGEVMYEI